MAVLGLRCFARAFSSCGEWELLLITAPRFLIAVPPAVEHRAQACRGRLSSRGAWAQLLCSLWDLSRPGTETVSSALAGGFVTIGPPGKSCLLLESRVSLHLPALLEPPGLWPHQPLACSPCAISAYVVGSLSSSFFPFEGKALSLIWGSLQ